MFSPRRSSKRRIFTPSQHAQTLPKSDLQELDEAITRIELLIKKQCQKIFDKAVDARDVSAQHDLSTLHHRASFIPISTADEEELIELLRRTAELVVQGERRAAAVERRTSTDQHSSKYATSSNSMLSDGRRKSIDDLNQQKTSSRGETDLDDKEREMQVHSSLFDRFLERNVLSTIVGLVSGASFSNAARSTNSTSKLDGQQKETTENKPQQADATEDVKQSDIVLTVTNSADLEESSRQSLVYLPSISIATQAVQSTAILIQNVSQATSLYLLLSNNRVNDLIGLPLEMYTNALEQQELFLSSRTGDLKDTSSHTSRSGKEPRKEFPEISELATHFVSFLKSLVVRINLETLQFYIRYASDPATHISSIVDGSFMHSTNKPLTDDSITIMSDGFIGATCLIQPEDIEFPLYARALEFCSPNQDSFVRLTAMNICLNTLRLATVTSQLQHCSHENDSQAKATAETSTTCDNVIQSIDKTKSPDATLERIDLPFRERISIAHHICQPERVEPFIGPIFCRLCHLTEALKEALLAIDNFSDSEVCEHKELDARTVKISVAVEDIAADIQDELLLLDDVLKMGLTPLNEQIIEMMLCNFIYPTLLQPLLPCLENVSEYQESNFETFEYLEKSVEDFASSLPQNLYPNSLLSLKEPQLTSDIIIAKSSLLVLYCIFNTITNTHLLRLVFTALFHPKAPDEKCTETIAVKPSVVSHLGDELQLRLDCFSNNTVKYDFGRSSPPHSGRKGVCIFAFSPALSKILDGIGIVKTRPNVYRKIMLMCLTEKNESDLQKAAILPFSAAVEALGEFSEEILYGQSITSAEEILSDGCPIVLDNNDDCINEQGSSRDSASDSEVSYASECSRSKKGLFVELLAALIACVTTSTVCINGVWRLDYNKTVARVLLQIIGTNVFAARVAMKLLIRRKQKSALFLSQLPASVDIGFVDALHKMGEVEGPVSITENQDEQQLNLIMDRLVRDTWDGKGGCILDAVLKNEHVNGSVTLSVVVAEKCLLGQACKDILASRKIVVSEGMDAAMSCAADSIFAHFQLDALAAYVSGDLNAAKYSLDDHIVVAPLSTQQTTALLDQDGESVDRRPNPGDVVDLVGRVAFPCVCEVNEASHFLFTDQRACVVADGVRWQSLYLVFLGRYMLLAEPVKQGSGGTGRIVTFCCLACLKVSKDKAPISSSQFSARRLILRHESLDPTIPGVFSCRGGQTGSAITRSRMDLWFENDKSANVALETFVAKIYTERARRGKYLRDSLLKMGRN